MRAAAVCVAFAAIGGAAPAFALPPTSQGSVLFVTGARAYLDRGAADGLTKGQGVRLFRRGAPVTTCTLELVSEHAGTCRTTAARVGDAFVVVHHMREEVARAVELPAPSAPELERDRAKALADAPVALVEFQPRAAVASGGSAWVTVGASAWGARGDAAAYQSAQVDARLSRVPLGFGDLRLDLSVSAVQWQSRLDEERFRPERPSQLYVWQAEVSRRELDSRTVLAFGRLWPWHLPGVPVLDGLQLGRRNESGTVEWGAYGGTLPSRLTLAPLRDQWTAGVYAALARPGRRGDVLRFSRQEARFGTRFSDSIGQVQEAEGLAEASLGAWSLGGGGRLRHAAQIDAGPVVEQAHLELRLRPSQTAGAWAQLRHVGVAPEIVPLLVNEAVAIDGGLHATGGAWAEVGRGLGLGLGGAWHDDRDSSRRALQGSLELQAPRVFGDAGGLWLGANVMEGWLRSRGVYAQFVSSRLRLLQLVARVDAAATRFAAADARAVDLGDAGGYLHLQLRLGEHARLRARALARLPLGGGPSQPTTLAFVGGVDLTGTWGR
jgi:hypothetical protein